ncbi:hypothetical protein G6011_11357 [Alternaria panax]|uniref:Uncharacterized protein n=1 Tax=Alternaria panax TaxID=48097 RepID=A0AAD4NRH6_9PLEO|nr:hypothetical protein G6011_11357 [Alternaria panax]
MSIKPQAIRRYFNSIKKSEGPTKLITLPQSFNPMASILTAPPSTGAVTLDVGDAECFPVLLARDVLEEPDPVVEVGVGTESARDLQASEGDKAAGLVGYMSLDVLESCELSSGTSGASGASGFGRSGLGAGAMGSWGVMGVMGSIGV